MSMTSKLSTGTHIRDCSIAL